jgi:hypothetical protein
MGGLPAPIYPIEVGPPMTLAETRTYVNARLRRADPSGVIAERLDAERMAELQRASGGVPARLHVLLDAWLRGAPAAEALKEHSPSPEPERAPAPAPLPEPEPVPAVVAPPPTARRPVRPAAPAPEHRAFFRGRRRRRSALPLALLVLLAIAGVWRFGPPAETWRQLAGSLQERTLAPRSEFPPAAAQAPEPAPQLTEPAPLAAAPEPEALPDAEIAPPEAIPESPPEAPAPVDVAAAPPAEPMPPEPAAQAVEPEPALPESAESAPEPPPAAEPSPEPGPNPPPEVAAAPPSPEPAPAVAALVAPLAPPPGGPRLSVNAEPWAEIQLDGRPVGETPIGELPVTPGPHRLRATLPDGRVIERSIEARAGDLYVVFP